MGIRKAALLCLACGLFAAPALAGYEDDRLGRANLVESSLKPVAAAMGELRFCHRMAESESLQRRLEALRSLLVAAEMTLLAEAKGDAGQEDALLAMLPYLGVGGQMTALEAGRAEVTLQNEAIAAGHPEWHDKCGDAARIYLDAVAIVDAIGRRVYGAPDWLEWAEANPFSIDAGTDGVSSE